jgi:Flp pilus assembly protein CpaB
VMPLDPRGLPLTGAQAIPLTRTIVSDALVLTAPVASSGPSSQTDSSHGPVITLAIDDNQVNDVLFAQSKGTVWFALRPPGKSQDVGGGVVDVGAVLRGSNKAGGNVLRVTGAGR